jgi:hypothetical protein
MIYVSQYKKVFHVEGSPEEEKKAKQRAYRAMLAQERKERERERDIERRGYCMDCNYLLSIQHKCPKCGTVWSFRKTQH